MADKSVRVDVYTGAGTKVGPGPVTAVLAGEYELGVGAVGSFKLDIPAEDPRSSLIGHGYELRVHRGDEGLVFRGIVDKLSTIVGNNDTKVLRVTGASLGRKLVWGNTLLGLQFSNTALATAVSTLLGYASGFTAGVIDTPTTVLEAQRMDGISVWGALIRVAETFGLLLREDNINARVDMGAFGANPGGLRFQSVAQMTPELAASPNVFAIADIQEIATSEDCWTKVIPVGGTQGIAGAGPAMNLRYSTRSGQPYVITSYTGPDGEAQYSMEDTAATAALGGVARTKTLLIKDASPLGLGPSTDFVAAANTLYDRASTWLTRHKTVQTAYAVRVLGMKHLVNELPVFSVGDRVRVVYRGAVPDSTGLTMLWKNIDQYFYIMRARRTWAGATDVWDFELSDVPRAVDDDGNRSAALLEQVQTLQAVPSPFIMLASAALRADKYGFQSRRLSGQYPFEAISGNYGATIPAGNEDIDLIADGVINILDLSYASATYPPRRSGSFIWHGESDFVDGAIPGSMFAGTGGDPIPTGGTPTLQAFLQGLAAKIPNGNPLTESVETSHGVVGTWGIAGVGAHQNKTTLSQADATIRAQNIGGTLIAGFDVKAKADNTALVKLLGALAQAATVKAQITSNQNDYDIGAKTGASFAISSDAARDITGILATSVADGTLLFVQNVGSFAITLKDESASSSAANRFALTGDIALNPDAGVILQYNATASRWRALAVPGGAGMNKVTGSGYLVMPAAATGISPANAGVAWNNGAWSQVVASTSEDDSIVGIIYGWDSLLGTTRVEAEIDIGTGGAGSETAVSTIPAIRQQSVSGGLSASNVTGASDERMVMFPAPIEVASGTRVAVRVRSGDTGLEPSNIRLIYAKKAELVAR